MRVSLILAHPDRHSFNHAIAKAVAEELSSAGHDVRFHDLYEEKFDPILPPGEAQRGATLPPLVKQHCDELAQAEGIVIVDPSEHRFRSCAERR